MKNVKKIAVVFLVVVGGISVQSRVTDSFDDREQAIMEEENQHLLGLIAWDPGKVIKPKKQPTKSA